MDDISLSVFFVALFLLFTLSAFFSGSETALMALNKYRLRYKAKEGRRGARYAQHMLAKPDRLIGIILLGNNLTNIIITQLASYIGFRISGELGIAIATGVLTITLLIFAELTPKTLAAVHSEKIAYPAAYILRPLMSKYSPATWLTWLVNLIANGILRLFGINPTIQASLALNRDELKSVLKEGNLIPLSHREMLTNILDLEQATVNDIMTPRNELIGIDLEDDWNDIIDQIASSQHTRLPVFRGSIDNIVGFVHLRKLFYLMHEGDLTRENLEALIRPPYFIPEGASLTKQLLAFRKERRRVGVVVDEYGDLQGLVTLEDILEEIVGEFTTDPYAADKDIYPQRDGSYIVDGGTHLRNINKILHWSLPTDGPKTLNGFILEHTEMIPRPGTLIELKGHTFEIIIAEDNAIKTARLYPNTQPVSKHAGKS